MKKYLILMAALTMTATSYAGARALTGVGMGFSVSKHYTFAPKRQRLRDPCCGYWILRHTADPWKVRDRDEWFLVEIKRHQNRSDFYGVLAVRGTSQALDHSPIFEITRVGGEYWGEFTGCTREPFRAQFGPHEMTLMTQRGKVFHGQRVEAHAVARYRVPPPRVSLGFGLSFGTFRLC